MDIEAWLLELGLERHAQAFRENAVGVDILPQLTDEHSTAWLGFLAGAHLRAGQLNEALCSLDRATETAAVTDESHYLAELYRLRGTVLAETGEAAEAASWLQRAIDTARSQQAKSLELRAATSLAGLWADQGKRTQAHDLLAPL